MHDCLGEEIHCLVQIVGGTLLEMVAAFEVEILSLGTGRLRGSQRILIPGFAMAERKDEKRASDQQQRHEPEKCHYPGHSGGRRNQAKRRRGIDGNPDGQEIAWNAAVTACLGGSFLYGRAFYGFPVMERRLEPLRQLFGVREYATASASRHTVDGKSAFFFPTFDSALVAIKEGCNFLPRI